MVLGLLLVVIAGAIAWQILRLREPTYGGKSLSQWVRQYDRLSNHSVRSGADEQLRDESLKAICSIGTNAIPCLLTKLRAHDSQLQARMKDLARRLPSSLIQVQTAMEVRREGASGFRALGRQGNIAVPELAKLLNDRSDPSIANNAIYVLAIFDDEVVVPVLVDATTNADPIVRGAAVVDLGCRRSTANGVIESLLSRVADPDARVRTATAYAFGKFGNKPDLLVPALIVSLQDSNIAVQDMAASSLGNFGEKAKAAVPGLTDIVKARGSACTAASALLSIDPVAAEKAGVKRFTSPPNFE